MTDQTTLNSITRINEMKGRVPIGGCDAEYRQLNMSIVELIDHAKKNGIFAAEALRMVLKNFGWMWDDIPYGTFPSLKIFFNSFSGDRKLKILDPAFFSKLETKRLECSTTCKHSCRGCPECKQAVTIKTVPKAEAENTHHAESKQQDADVDIECVW